jgi:hypothetical protein
MGIRRLVDMSGKQSPKSEDMSENTNAVAAAEQTLKRLENRRRLLIERGQEIAETRKRISFAALADGDQKAKRALDDLNTEAIAHGVEMESALAAIAEAERRVVAARRAEAEQQDRANAVAIKKVIAELGEHAGHADDCLHDLVEAGDRLKHCFEKLQALGISQPRTEQLMTLGNLAIQTALSRSQLWKRYFQTLAPHERRDFTSVCAAWSKSLEAEVERRLGEKQAEVAA